MRTSIKILLLTVTSFLFVENVLRAQSWTAASPNIYFTGGNVGIGTAAPAATLDVVAANAAFAKFSGAANGYVDFTEAGGVLSRLQNSGALYFGTVSNHDMNFKTNSTNKMTILAGGNVGIGTTNPLSALHIDNATGLSLDVAAQAYSAPLKYLENHILRGRLITISGNLNYESYNSSGTYLRTDLAILNSNGNVGFGTTNPLAKLHVNNGSLLFDGTTGATPTSGAGTRMMWIPALSAFRAGVVGGTTWDNANIGLYSSAFGGSTTASGWYSSAFGSGTIASGLFSASFGYATTASGATSFAVGEGTTAQPYDSFVLGRYNTISGTSGSWVATDPLFVIGNGSSTSVRSNAVTVLKNGNVGIGTALVNNPNSYKLAVNGTIGAKAVKVEITSTTWPDFIFNKGYNKLKTLKEVEQYILENGHLPEIPTAKEIETNGADIGELLKLQMKKIEELTLYIIEQNKRILVLEGK